MKPMKPTLARVMAITLPALLAACGGGGGDDAGAAGDAAAAATPAAVATPTAEAAAEMGAGAGAGAGAAPGAANCGIAGFADAALARINQRRAAGASCGARGSFAPAGAVRWNDALAEAAAAHSLDMATRNYFSHTSADGRSMAERVNATGYLWSTLGENIAAGQVGLDAVIDGWMRSDGHCANLMNAAFDTVGLACVPGASGSGFGTYWTLDLARGR